MNIAINNREKYLFAITILLITGSLLYNFAINPFYVKWKNFDKEMLSKQIKLRKNIKLLKNKNSIIEEYNEYALKVNLSKLLKYIEKEARYLDIKTSNIKPMPMVKEELYDKYLIELEIEGEIVSINKFVSKLIKYPAVTVLEKFNLNPNKKQPSILKGTLVLSRVVI